MKSMKVIFSDNKQWPLLSAFMLTEWWLKFETNLEFKKISLLVI